MSHEKRLDDQVATLYESFSGGEISRRDFMGRAAALGVAGVAASALGPLVGSGEAASLAQASLAQLSAAKTLALDVAEWSYMWVNVKRADTARASFTGGQQMYVEYMVPARVTKPYPIVLVHGGGGQGLDWMGTPDGRPGWFQHLVASGYRVYVVDRPGHGRAPQHPDLHGAIPERPRTMEDLQSNFILPAANNTDPYRKSHNQWPGPGIPGSSEVGQFIASQGGSYVVTPARGGGPGPAGGGQGGGRGAAAQGPPVPANQQPAGQPNLAHMAWREAGAELLDRIGPAIIITHSAGGAFGLLVAEARPNLVKATVMIEGGGSGFAQGNRYGMSTIPVTWNPPVRDISEIKARWVANPEPDVDGYFLQEEPARALPNLRNVAVLVVTAPASQAAPGNPGAPTFLKQAGVRVAEELRLGSIGIQGNAHMMMVEKNHREVLQPILDWLDKNVSGRAPAIRKRGADSTAVKLSNMGYFWLGAEPVKKDYGTIVVGQSFVQYAIPQEIRQPLPIVIVHGGGSGGHEYLGLNGNAGWGHYYLQAGYQVYIVDRPAHGRSPVSIESTGRLGPHPILTNNSNDFQGSANATPRRWPGTGRVDDPEFMQFAAGLNAIPADGQLMQSYWRSRGAELLDKIGPAIVQTHSAGGPFGWIAAMERPNLVKALVSFEGAPGPTLGPNSSPVPMPAVKGIPIMYLTAANSGRPNGPAIIASLKASGADAEHINLRDKGILGNGHFAMFETNRKEVWEVIRGWIESKVGPAPGVRQTARG